MATTIGGILRRFVGKQLIIEADDHRIVWFRQADDFQLEDAKGQISSADKFAPGDHVRVDAVYSEDADPGTNYNASSMRWIKEGSEADREEAGRTWDLPTTAQLPADTRSDRPVVRRGGPPAQEEPPEEPAPRARTEEAARPALPEQPDDLSIAKAREAALAFLETLPAFSTRQSTTRYVRETARGEWRAQDIVSANLVYKDGEEVYSDIRVGKNRAAGRMEDIEGMRSTGEFGSMLEEIFDPDTGTRFVRGSPDQIRGRRTVKFAFSVSRERSRFRIMAPSELYYAAYRGTLWIDVETDRVMRLEEQASGLPEAFPFDTVEMAIDYDFIRLETRTFLLPTESQALDCVRTSRVCMRNETSFRNYVKYQAESGIVFEPPSKQ